MTDSASFDLRSRLRAGCRAARRENPEWRRQAGNTTRNTITRKVKTAVSRFFENGICVWFLIVIASQTGDGKLTESTAGLALASLSLLYYFKARVWFAWACRPDHTNAAYAMLPVSNDWIVRRKLRKWVRSMSPICITCVLCLLVIGWSAASGWRLWAGALLGGIALFVMLGALAVCAAPRPWLQWVLLPFNLLAWAALLFLGRSDEFGRYVVPWLNAHSDQLAWLVPTAWVIRPAQEFFHSGPFSSFPLLLPAAALVWFAWWETRLLIVRLRPREEFLYRYAAQLPEDTEDEIAAEFHRAIDRPPDAPEEEVTALLRSRAFLEVRPPPHDWITRLAWHWWSPRERLLAEWNHASWPRWPRRWMLGAGWMMLAFVLGSLAKPTYPNGWLIAWLLPTIVGAMLLLPCRMEWNCWSNRRFIGSGFANLITLSPVTVPELVRMDRKLACIRMLVALPVILLCGLGLKSLTGLETHEVLSGAVLVALLALGLRPVLLAMHLSGQSPDKSLRTQLWDFVMLGITILAGALAAISFFGVIVPNSYKLLMLAPMTLSLLFFSLVGRLSIWLWARRRLSGVSFLQT